MTRERELMLEAKDRMELAAALNTRRGLMAQIERAIAAIKFALKLECDPEPTMPLHRHD